MKQILQSLDSGQTEVAEIPCPRCRAGHLLIRSHRTLISAGTERMLVEFGKANYLDKARQKPEKVKQVLDKVRTDGLLPTYQAVQSKLAQPMALGYCNVGTVLEVGEGVSGYEVGDRVVSNGRHAEIVCVPEKLCVQVPEGVSDDQAVFTVIGSIGLQGMRLAAPTLGECFVVTGLGLIGLLTVQLLRANGCRVLGIDFDEAKLDIAREFGAETVNLSAGEDPVEKARAFSRGRGVDGVLITASTTSSEPVSQAADMCRKRGRIVLVGVVGLELNRADFYEKELSFQVSCSYGPGRYDANYEDKGLDYPIGFVRWTEQRNFEAILDMMAQENVETAPLITHRFGIAEASDAYSLLNSEEESIGIVLDYLHEEPDDAVRRRTLNIAGGRSPGARGKNVGVIGAGNYATRVFLPKLAKTDLSLHTIASSGGMSGFVAARKFDFKQTTTDTEEIFSNPDIGSVFVLTRHDNHAEFVAKALAAGKNVFVEKPLAITRDQLGLVRDAREKAGGDEGPLLMVGFNRRFAPHVITMKELLEPISVPKNLIMTVNAGDIPADSWVQDTEIGGGRIIGEGCHFVDLLRFLVGHPVVAAQAMSLGDHPALEITEDKTTITLGFEDGSVGTIHYLANGDKGFPKERLEVFCDGKILVMDNYRKLTGYGWSGFGTQRSLFQDKGHAAGIEAFARATIEGGKAPIAYEEIDEVTEVCFDIVEAL